jgi:hypothetical protein
VRAKGASLKATEQPIDTWTAAGKCFLDMLGVFGEFETNLRPERQLEGDREGQGRRRVQGPAGFDRRRPGTSDEGAGPRSIRDREGTQDRPGVGLQGAGSRLIAPSWAARTFWHNSCVPDGCAGPPCDSRQHPCPCVGPNLSSVRLGPKPYWMPAGRSAAARPDGTRFAAQEKTPRRMRKIIAIRPEQTGFALARSKRFRMLDHLREAAGRQRGGYRGLPP